MEIRLPLPPSVNHLYGRNGYRTYITDAGVAWFTEAGYMVNTAWQVRIPIESPIKLYIRLHTCKRYDIDNCLKATQDLLTKQGVIVDDSQIMFLQVEKVKEKHQNQTCIDLRIEF